jgi:hypothetical protein
MKQLIQFKEIRRFPKQFGRSTMFVTLVACIALSKQAGGVVPAPGGVYPNFTTAQGQNALLSLSTGAANTAVGWFSLESITTGSFNTGIGAGTLVFNTGDENTAIGTAALLLNTASGNTAVGSRALLNNTTGGTLESVQGVDVGPNVAIGWQALERNTVAGGNTAMGYQALQSFTTGPAGFEQLGLSTAVGFQALANATGAFGNSAFGYQALVNNTTGGGNTANGLRALFSNSTGINNTANGGQALYYNTSGESNTASGINALVDNTTGSDNTAIGQSALQANTTGNNNIALGALAGGGITTADNVIAIGHVGFNVNNTCFIGNIRGVTTGAPDAIPVVIDSVGQLGTMSSSRRFKRDIKPMDNVSEGILALKPVTFHYKNDTIDRPQFGLIAEEVAEANPDLVVRDENGEIYTVRYDAVNAMLLNEFLKEHRKVQEQDCKIERQEARIAELMQQVEGLVASFREQDSKIQKVCAQLKLDRPIPQIACASN